MAGASPALSGLQKEVLALFRKCLRVSSQKGPAKPLFQHYARSEFNRFKLLNKRDFTTIEHLLRSGNKRLDTMANPQVKNINN